MMKYGVHVGPVAVLPPDKTYLLKINVYPVVKLILGRPKRIWFAGYMVNCLLFSINRLRR